MFTLLENKRLSCHVSWSLSMVTTFRKCNQFYSLGTIYDGLLTQREWKSGSVVRRSQFPQLAWKEVMVGNLAGCVLTNQEKVLEMPPYLKTFQRKADWLQRWREQGERCRQGRGGQLDRARTRLQIFQKIGHSKDVSETVKSKPSVNITMAAAGFLHIFES